MVSFVMLIIEPFSWILIVSGRVIKTPRIVFQSDIFFPYEINKGYSV